MNHSEKKCPNCNFPYSSEIDFCETCGAKLPDKDSNLNSCTNESCQNYVNKIELNPKQQYCGKCGSPSTYFKPVLDMI